MNASESTGPRLRAAVRSVVKRKCWSERRRWAEEGRRDCCSAVQRRGIVGKDVGNVEIHEWELEERIPSVRRAWALGLWVEVAGMVRVGTKVRSVLRFRRERRGTKAILVCAGIGEVARIPIPAFGIGVGTMEVVVILSAGRVERKCVWAVGRDMVVR